MTPLKIVLLYTSGHIGSAITLNRLVHSKEYQIIGIIKTPLVSLSFRGKKSIVSQMKKMGLEEFDLNKVPGKELIKKLTNHLKDRYPNVHLVLIHERNVIMSKNLIKLSKTNPEKKILAIIGAGHEDGMIPLIKKFDKTIEVPNS